MTKKSTDAAPKDDSAKIEYDMLVTALTANAVSRDNFLGLAHTALFAASLAFVSSLSESGHASGVCLLIISWLSSVIGLLSLAASYWTAHKHILTRIKEIHNDEETRSDFTDRLNNLAIGTFVISLILTFLFSSINVARMENKMDTTPLETRGISAAPRAPGPNTGLGNGVPPAPRMPSPAPRPTPAPPSNPKK